MKKIIQFCVFLTVLACFNAMAKDTPWGFTITNKSGKPLTATIFWQGGSSTTTIGGNGGEFKGSHNGSRNDLTFGVSVGPYFFMFQNGGHGFGGSVFNDAHKINYKEFSNNNGVSGPAHLEWAWHVYVYGPTGTTSSDVTINNWGTTDCIWLDTGSGGCNAYTNFTIHSAPSTLPNFPT